MQFTEMKAIGQTLSHWRKEQGFTQQAVSKKVKIDRQTISTIERGQFTGSLAILLRYANYAGYELGLAPRLSPFPTLDSLKDRYGDDDE